MRILVCVLLCCISPLFMLASDQKNQKNMELRIIKKETDPNKDIFLLLSGIQGDEPGGFNAASILASDHYKIKSGNVWIVPNLNQHSILENHRGIYGDMNRKFAALNDKDPEKPLIESIKKLIKEDQVEAILHLHDGSGFYHETYIDHLRNPNRWGQSSIIDQEKLENVVHGELNEIMKQVTTEMNQQLLSDSHRYRIRNTHTATSDKEQQKSLTFYAINQGKAAFANEASKSLPLHERVYYHLLAIEAMMRYLKIDFERDFSLTPNGVKRVINDGNICISFSNRITLPINRLKNYITYFPMPKKGTLSYESTNPIVHLYRKNGVYQIKYGNRIAARLQPDFFESDDSLVNVRINIDGEVQEVALGDIVKAKQSFAVEKIHDASVRVNIIGFSKKGVLSEEGIVIQKGKIDSRYTLDKEGQLVRIEFYRDQKFSGMVLIDFMQ